MITRCGFNGRENKEEIAIPHKRWGFTAHKMCHNSQNPKRWGCESDYFEGVELDGVDGDEFEMILEHRFQPVILFSFSRRECEQHAMSM
ncbi:DExH-box ATP-dependent RNA helicase DExH10-like protein [Drosera capensis]